MRRRVTLVAALLACVAGSAFAAVPTLEATRALAAGLKRTGRAEVTLAWDVPAAGGEALTHHHGTLAIEPPDLARLDVAGTGEHITLRSDGGEWLQPSLHQMMLLKPRHSVAAMRWWRVLAGSAGVTERKLATNRYRLFIAGSVDAPADSADVTLGAGSLPERLVLDDGAGGHSVYKLTSWRFTKARGPDAFHVSAPAGSEVVELP